MSKILIVDDEQAILDVLTYNLAKAGHQAIVAQDGPAALSLARSEAPDLVILDLMLPGIDGLEVAQKLRREGDLPIIMLTARVDDTDRIIGLELGADDYVTKPFNPRELVARVRAVLRRTSGTAPVNEVLTAGDIELDITAHRATRAGRLLDLTPTEFDLLSVMMRHPGRAFTRLELLDRVQGYAYEGYERTVDAHIKNLRAKLGDDPRRPQYIQTVYGVGYKFEDVV